MDFEINTGKLELHMEKNKVGAGKNRQILFFSVFSVFGLYLLLLPCCILESIWQMYKSNL